MAPECSSAYSICFPFLSVVYATSIIMVASVGSSSTHRPGTKVLEKKRSSRTKNRAKREVKNSRFFSFCPLLVRSNYKHRTQAQNSITMRCSEAELCRQIGYFTTTYVYSINYLVCTR